MAATASIASRGEQGIDVSLEQRPRHAALAAWVAPPPAAGFRSRRRARADHLARRWPQRNGSDAAGCC